MEKTNKIVLVTGATSGIGKAIAIELAANGYDIIITGRRADRLMKLEQEIKSVSKVRVLSMHFDVRDLSAVEAAFKKLPAEWNHISILVNNAGLAAGLDFIQTGDLLDWDQMIDTNVKGLLYVSKMVIPEMIAKGEGHIINISSIAGKEVYPKGNVYCASKHAVDALTKGMRMDLLEHGIKVSSISPGMVETEFSVVRFKGDKEKADSVYNGLTPLYAADIAQTVAFIVSRPKHVNINDIVIMPTAQASAAVTHRKL